MRFHPSQCPGLVLVHRDELPFNLFDDHLEYKLMSDRSWLTHNRSTRVPIGGPYDQVQAVSAALADSDVDWTEDVLTRMHTDNEYAKHVQDVMRSAISVVDGHHG